MHINGYVTLPDGSKELWVARRSRTKPTWPGKLDHIVAGGQPHGLRWGQRCSGLRAGAGGEGSGGVERSAVQVSAAEAGPRFSQTQAPCTVHHASLALPAAPTIPSAPLPQLPGECGEGV